MSRAKGRLQAESPALLWNWAYICELERSLKSDAEPTNVHPFVTHAPGYRVQV
jgi:hypothetical protein